jgi:hypothetical protein
MALARPDVPIADVLNERRRAASRPELNGGLIAELRR